MPNARRARPKGGGASTEILSAADVAYELGMHIDTVHRLIRDGHIRTLTGFRHYRVTRQALDDYLHGTPQ